MEPSSPPCRQAYLHLTIDLVRQAVPLATTTMQKRGKGGYRCGEQAEPGGYRDEFRS